jgi:hypothetical protein
VLVLIATALYVFPCWWGLPAGNPSWAYDEIHPAEVVNPGSWTPFYPPAHRHFLWAVLTVLQPFIENSTPNNWENSDVQLLAARGLSVVLAAATLIVLYASARRLFDRRSALVSVICFGFGSTYAFYAKTVNLEVPYLFWYALSVYFFLRCLEDRRWFFYLLFAATGALSITTKTQAFGLYVLSPFVLVHDLRANDDGRQEPLWRALLDRRILEAAAVCLAVVLIVFRRGELIAHIEAVRSFEHFDPGGTGLRTFLTQTLENLAFVSGAHVALAALAGFALSLRRPRRNVVHTRLLQLLLFVIPYYLLFVVRTGFNYDRHYLPVALVSSLFAAYAFARLESRRMWVRLLRGTALALVFVVGLLRALSVDLLLHGDPRYEAERWIQTLPSSQMIIGLGNRQVLPRNLTTVPTKRFAKWRRGEHGHNPMVWHNCSVLNELDADLLLTPTPQLLGPGVNYRELRRFRNRAGFSLVDFSNHYASNISKIARDLIVYERTSQECVDSGWLPMTLHELRSDLDRSRRQAVARAIARSSLIPSRRLTWSDMKAVRIDPEFWTIGTQPAGIVLANTWFEQVTPRLQLTVPLLDATDFPATVFIDDGVVTRELVFQRAGRQEVDLAPVDGEAHRLYIIWINRAFRTPEGKLRGVRLLPAGDPGDPFERLTAALAKLAAGAAEERRAAFIRSVLAGAAGEVVSVTDGVSLVATWRDRWTYGTSPAGLIIHNHKREPVRPRVRVTCDSVDPGPVHLMIEDGVRRQSYALDCSKLESIKLGRIRPGERRLFILQSDYASIPQTPTEKLRGVQVMEVLLDPKEVRQQTTGAGTSPTAGGKTGEEPVIGRTASK